MVGGVAVGATAHADLYRLVPVELRSHSASRGFQPVVDGINPVEDEVYQDLLKMDAIGRHKGKIVLYFQVHLHLPCYSVGPHKGDGIANEFTHIDRSFLEAVPLEQPAHPVNDASCALVVLFYVVKDRPYFVKIRRCVLQEKLRRFSIAQDCAKRLTA